MKVFIINYNRVTLPSHLADWCYNNGLTPIFVDNNSDYPPLLSYYSSCPYEVLRYNQNYGHTVMWNPDLAILQKLNITGRYIVTDPDLDLSKIPSDFLQVLHNGLDRFNVDKCGFSLEIKDLPNSKEGNFIRNKCEVRYWKRPIDGLYFNAPIDTTFALYREGVSKYSHSAVRTNRPYTARHIPWYYIDLNKLPEDEKYYYKTASSVFSTGKKRMVG